METWMANGQGHGCDVVVALGVGSGVLGCGGIEDGGLLVGNMLGDVVEDVPGDGQAVEADENEVDGEEPTEERPLGRSGRRFV